MLADPRHSCIVFLNLTRGTASAPMESVLENRHGSMALLPICREIFAISQLAVGEYDREAVPGHIAAAIEHIDVDPLCLWQESSFAERLSGANAMAIFLGGAFLEEEVFLAALEGARRGYDIRLLSDLTTARIESDRTLVLNRLAHHGVLATTIRQALLEWALSMNDPTVVKKVRQFLS